MIDAILTWLWTLPLHAHGDPLEKMILLGLIALAPTVVLALVIDHFLSRHLRLGPRAPHGFVTRGACAIARIVFITFSSAPTILFWNSYPMLVPAWIAIVDGSFLRAAAAQSESVAALNLWLLAASSGLAVLWVTAGSGPRCPPAPTSPHPAATARIHRFRCRALRSWWARR